MRAQLGPLFNPDDFTNYVNQALERVVNGGLWKGSIGYTAFPTVDNYFTLPYPYLAVVGAQWLRCPVPVFGQFHDFIQGGPGQPIANLPPEGIVEDLGDGYATMSDPPTPYSTIYIQTDLTIDNGKTFRIFGNSNGREVFDVFGSGMYLNVNTSETTVFDQVTGIQVPTSNNGASSMVGGWTLYSVAPNGTRTSLGYYYPNETNPSYRRYRIGVTSAVNTQVPNAVTVLVRRRYMPVFKETDPVNPGNIGGMKFAMQAIDSEASKNSAQAFWDQAYAIYNQELHATRGSNRPEMNWEALGSGAIFDNVY